MCNVAEQLTPTQPHNIFLKSKEWKMIFKYEYIFSKNNYIFTNCNEQLIQFKLFYLTDLTLETELLILFE